MRTRILLHSISSCMVGTIRNRLSKIHQRSSPTVLPTSLEMLNMHYIQSLLLLILSSGALAKPCSTTSTTPLACDYDQWHQERKLVIGPSGQVNIQCWSIGRSVAGNNKWFYLGDRECWVSGRYFGVGCEGRTRIRRERVEMDLLTRI